MTEQQKAELREWLEDAKAKQAALPGRIKTEAADAAKERRKPYPITPYTEVNPATMREALKEIGTGNVPDEIATPYGVLRATCDTQDLPFAFRSDQLIDILSLAKLD